MIFCLFFNMFELEIWSHSTTEIDLNSNLVVHAKCSWGWLFQMYRGLENVVLKYSTDGPLRKFGFLGGITLFAIEFSAKIATFLKC